jgi:hypothetical protein
MAVLFLILLGSSVAVRLGLPVQQPGDERDRIVMAAATACSGEQDPEECMTDAVVWAKNESRMQAHPHAYSSDAKLGLSCGPWQVQCSLGDSLDRQAKHWVSLRRYSIFHCGSMALVASGSCSRGTRLAEERAEEASLIAQPFVGW